MRLWPTTPLPPRETLDGVTLAGEEVDEGAQVIIVNHRDPERVPDADLVRPERWADGDPDPYRFNHLSNGSQDCPGGPLVYLLGNAVLANVLDRYALTLLEPELPAGRPLPLVLDPAGIRFGAANVAAG